MGADVANAPAWVAPWAALSWLFGGLLVVGVALRVFLNGPPEPVFPDESAYAAQTYFYDLLIQGRRDDWAWLEYHAYDLPPLPKYAFGLAIEGAGFQAPDRRAASLWFRNIRAEVVPEALVRAARWPSAVFGALGCLAVYALGTLAVDRRVGLIAALLLAADPLYRLHARRAMSDVPAECFIQASLAVGLFAWKRGLEGRLRRLPWLVLWCASGLLAGLAVLSKLNGALACLTLIAWAALAGLQRGIRLRRRLAVAAGVPVALGVSLAIFVALNPYVTARPSGPPPSDLLLPAPPDQSPWERLAAMLRHRVEVSRKGQNDFPHNALRSFPDKAAAVIVQGFGRFGPLGPTDHDSTVPYPRFDVGRDWGLALWLPTVLAGGVVLARRGRRQHAEGRAPTAHALLVQALLALVVVTAFIPLAWDRYHLPLQPPAVLLAASALAAVDDVLRRRGRVEA
jgi:4-amino-4-deoxy-L-arabinose transferase-like glycosyltransferase